MLLVDVIVQRERTYVAQSLLSVNVKDTCSVPWRLSRSWG